MLKEISELSAAVRQHAQALSPRLRQIRRCLHQRPELSEQEQATTALLAELLTELGTEPHFAGDHRGVWGDIEIGDLSSAHRVVIRGDIDALPLQTKLQTAYASRTEGVMHACGHDAHATMAWGAAAILKHLADSGELPAPFAARVVFQPAEETSTGGIHMIAAGALDNVDAAIALHVDPTRPVGTFGYRDAAFTAGCDVFQVSLTGSSGHGARPHLTGDTIAAAAAWITALYSRVPRSYDARDPIVINIGQIHGGIAANVVPGEVTMGGTVRTLSLEAGEHAKAQIARITQSIQWSHPVEVHVIFGRHTPPVINDPQINASFRRAAEKIVGSLNVQAIEQPSMGAEDFSFFGSKVPAAMMRVGVAGNGIGHQPLHTPDFDIDEAVLPLGAAALAMAAIDLQDGPHQTRA